jgi:peptide/nickel transport system substrate-binding protein
MVAAAVVLAGCSSPPQADDGERSLTIAVPFLFPGDPYFTHGLFLEPQAVYEPLWNYDESENSFVPRLASEYNLSDDRFVLELTLRDDVDFTDGVHFSAETLVEYLEILKQDEEAVGGYAFLNRYETSFEITGEYELTITTTQPMGYEFFAGVSWFMITSPDAALHHEEMNENPVGSGPYVLDSVEPEVSSTYVRNDDYWNADAVDFDRLTFIVYVDPIASLNAVKTGQVDASSLDLPLAAEAESSGLVVHEGGGQFGTLIILDLEGSIVPALADVRVRQAMNMVFDRAAIAETLDVGYGTVSSQPFAPWQDTYVEGGDDLYPYDVEAARDLMAEAGYEAGFDITIPAAPGGTQYSASYEPIVQQSLSEIGIRVTYEVFPGEGELFPAISSGKYPVVLMKMFFGNVYGYLKENTSPSLATMVTPETVDLIEAIDNGTASESEQASTRFGEMVVDDAWYVPFSRPATLWVTIPEVGMTPGLITGYPMLKDFVAKD